MEYEKDLSRPQSPVLRVWEACDELCVLKCWIMDDGCGQCDSDPFCEFVGRRIQESEETNSGERSNDFGARVIRLFRIRRKPLWLMYASMFTINKFEFSDFRRDVNVLALLRVCSVCVHACFA